RGRSVAERRGAERGADRRGHGRERNAAKGSEMIVMKFGGTSVESAEAIERVAGIVRERQAKHPVVVVSAMGKTTNKLLAIAGAAVEGRGGEALAALNELHEFHQRESAGLGVECE